MDRWIKYQKEKYNRKVVESDDGFILYNIYDDGTLYVHTIYVDKDARNKGGGFILEEILINKENPSVIFCDVDLESNNPELPLGGLLKYDYKIHKCLSDRIVLYKEISNG